MKNISSKIRYLLSAAIILTLISSIQISAHCDGLDGPVVKDARKALEAGNVNLVLKWVKEEYQEEITKVFDKTLSIRGLSPEAKDFADTYFFETLVRLHRAGEGAPYTGLKPAGRDIGPAITEADKAIETEKPQALVKFLQDAVHEGLHPRYMETIGKKNFDSNDVKAGREYVKAYVEFVHYVEKIHLITSGMNHSEAEAESHAH